MASKLGLHIIEPNRYKAYDGEIMASAPAIIKIFGGPTELGALKAYHDVLGDRTLFIARVAQFDTEVSDLIRGGASPQDAAQQMIARLVGVVTPQGLNFAYFECGPNEPGDEYMDWLNQYYAYIVPRLAALNIKSCCFNFSVCHPPFSAWQHLGDALAAIRAASGKSIVGLHQYGLFGNMQDEAGTRVLRHRNIPELRDFRIAITEGGLDSPPFASTGKNAEQYTSDLLWLDDELKKDTNVLGDAVFTCNAKQWTDFNIAGPVVESLFRYWKAQPPIEVPPPAPEPPPDTSEYVVLATTLNVRSGGGLDYPVIRKLKKNDRVKVLSVQDGWACIEPVENWASLGWLRRI